MMAVNTDKPAKREKTAISRGNGGKFLAGVSPNPGGRPKAAIRFRDLARLHDEDALKLVVSVLNNEKASDKDRLSAAQIILDRAHGKVTGEESVRAEDAEIPEEIRNMTDEQLIESLRQKQ